MNDYYLNLITETHYIQYGVFMLHPVYIFLD